MAQGGTVTPADPGSAALPIGSARPDLQVSDHTMYLQALLTDAANRANGTPGLAELLVIPYGNWKISSELLVPTVADPSSLDTYWQNGTLDPIRGFNVTTSLIQVNNAGGGNTWGIAGYT